MCIGFQLTKFRNQIALLIFMVSFCGIGNAQNFQDDTFLDSISPSIESFLKNGNYSSAIDKFKFILNRKNLDSTNLVIYNLKIASLYNKRVMHDSAFYYLNTTGRLLEENKQDENYILYNLELSKYYFFKRNTNKAMELAFENLALLENNENNFLAYKVFKNLGMMFLEEGDHKNSYKYLSRNDSIVIRLYDSLYFNEHQINLARFYFETKKYEKAEKLLLNADKYATNHQEIEQEFIAKSYLLKLYFETGQLLKSLALKNRIMELINILDYGPTINAIKKSTISINRLTKNNKTELDSALVQVTKIENINAKNNPRINLVYKENLAKALANDTNTSLEKVKKQTIITAQKIQDSLYQEALKAKYQELEVKYKTEQKEKENLLLKEEKIKQELRSQNLTKQKWILILMFVCILLVLIIVVSYTRAKKKQLLHTSRLNLIKAKQNEQEAIGIELHDNVAKKLEAISIQLKKANKPVLATDTESIKNEIRKLSRELSIVSFEESPFSEQIITLAAQYHSSQLNISIQGLDSIKWSEIESPIKYNLFAITREAISNSHNHAQAKNIALSFSQEKSKIKISIKDDGKGFQKDEVSLGRGLRNIISRAEDIGAKISIDGKINQGTQIALQLKLNTY